MPVRCEYYENWTGMKNQIGTRLSPRPALSCPMPILLCRKGCRNFNLLKFRYDKIFYFKIFLTVFFFLICLISEVNADTLHLKNGRSIEGLVKKEDEEDIVLDIGFGTIKFSRDEVESIDRATPEEVSRIYEQWEKQRLLEEERRLIKAEELKKKPTQKKKYRRREIEFSQENGHIVIETLLNKKVNVLLLLDTGASTILLTNKTAEKLEIKSREKEDRIVQVQVADGRKIDAKFIVLDSVKIGHVEIKDVPAVVLLDEDEMNIKDGLLGMSFLNRFNFQIDTVNKKLILEKRE